MSASLLPRMVAAVLSLTGVFVSTYLALYKFGLIGELVCGVGSCQTVQLSRWADLLGLPVAAWGVLFYLATLGVSLVGVQPRFAESRGPTIVLLALTGWGVVFSLWLTYLELFVIDAICQWCVVSAIITVLLLGAAIADWRLRRGDAESDSPGEAELA